MCANPEMMRTLAAELREEFAARKASRGSNTGRLGWKAAGCALAVSLALAAIL